MYTAKPIISQNIVANLEASNTSINVAFKRTPKSPPIVPAIKPSFIPEKFFSSGHKGTNVKRILMRIKIKLIKPNKPTSARSLKKSLSEARPIEEYPEPINGLLTNARMALGHSTSNLIDVDLSSKIGIDFGVGVGASSLLLVSLPGPRLLNRHLSNFYTVHTNLMKNR